MPIYYFIYPNYISIYLIVLVYLKYIYLPLTRASSGVMVAHLIATPHFLVASAESMVI